MILFRNNSSLMIIAPLKVLRNWKQNDSNRIQRHMRKCRFTQTSVAHREVKLLDGHIEMNTLGH